MRKLTKFSFDEARVRGGQKLAALQEMLGWSSLARVPQDEELLGLLGFSQPNELWSPREFLEYFRERKCPRFFAAFFDKTATLSVFKKKWPQAEPSLLKRAKGLTEGKFDLLGLKELDFGTPVDWNYEPLSGKRPPMMHWSRISELDAERSADKKIIWELNRHQHFTLLGQAYWLTGDELYARTFVSHLQSWMDQNPPKVGINWLSSLEIAFRSISWLWGFYFFKNSESFSPRIFFRALKFLYLNARHLETYLSTYFSPNTHLTGEALGLFYLGTLLPEFKEAERWKITGRRILLEQLPLHVRPDGVYFEQSSYYHRYTADFYTHFLTLSRANGESVPSEVEQRLQALLDHLMYITRPDGTTPLIGDDDGGRVAKLDNRPTNDFRATLSTGAGIFNRPDYKFVAGAPAEETLWLLGPDALEELDRLPPQTPDLKSAAFKSGGYYVMRDDWTNNANYLLFDCGPHGYANCGHAHADALSFELAVAGKTLLVDPGTYTYTGSTELRDWFRSSAAHNTLTIDGRSSSISAGPFSWKSITHCRTIDWKTGSRFDYVAGAHDGYLSDPQPVTHQRSILFLKQNYWILRDHVCSVTEHEVDVWFHFDSDADPLIEAGEGHEAYIGRSGGGTGLDVHCFAENGRWRREEGWVSHSYAQRDPARVYAFSAAVRDAHIVTVMLPRTGETRWQVREIEAIGGKALEVANDNWLDIVMIRTGDRVETARVASDFEWTWARFSTTDDGALPVELVLLEGAAVAVQGRELLKANQHFGYLEARRTGEQFQAKTDRGDKDAVLSVGG